MKSGKLSPLLVASMILMLGIVGGMAYFVALEGLTVLESPPTLLAMGGVIVMGIIGIAMVTSTRRQLHEQVGQILETQFSDLAMVQPELLAHHLRSVSGLPAKVPGQS